MSQIFPNFGAWLNTSGNGIPLFIAMGFYILALFGFLITKAPRKFIIDVTIFYFLVIAYGCALTILSPFQFEMRDMALIVKFIVMYLGIMCGYCAYKDFSSLSILQKIILTALFLQIVLYPINLVAPDGIIMDLYSFRDYSNNRFAGTWNYPYNLTVFLFLSGSICLFMVKTSSHSFQKLFYSLLIGIAAFLLIFATQSRSGTVAFFVSILYGIMLMFLYSVVKDKGKSLVWGISLIFIMAGCGYIFWIFLTEFARQEDFRHLAELSNKDSTIGQHRKSQIQYYLSTYLFVSPWRLFTGYGTSTNSDFYIESIVNYIFQYGLIGFLTFIIGPVLLVWWQSLNVLFSKAPPKITFGYGLVNCILFYIILIGISADVLSHFRFIPLFYFLMGVHFKFYSILKNNNFILSPTKSKEMLERN